MKVVINCCHGGYGVNPEYVDQCNPEDREDLKLIELIETLGSGELSDSYACLEVEDIPDGCSYHIDDHAGCESLSLFVEISLKDLKQGLSAEQLDLVSCVGVIHLAD